MEKESFSGRTVGGRQEAGVAGVTGVIGVFGIKVTYSVWLEEQAFDGDLGQIRHRISE